MVHLLSPTEENSDFFISLQCTSKLVSSVHPLYAPAKLVAPKNAPQKKNIVFCWELHKPVNKHLNIDIFLTKTDEFATGDLYLPSNPCEVLFIMDKWALLDLFLE